MISRFLKILLLLMPQLQCASQNSPINMKNNLSELLQAKFPFNANLKQGDFYFNPSETIEQVVTREAVFSESKSVLFFKTELTTSFLEYFKVSVIVGFEKDKTNHVYILLDPKYGIGQSEFFTWLTTLKLAPNTPAKKVALLLSDLYSQLGATVSIPTQNDHENEAIAIVMQNGRNYVDFTILSNNQDLISVQWKASSESKD